MTKKPISREQFLNDEVERGVAPLVGTLPKERIDFLRAEMRAMLETHPVLSRLVDRVAGPNPDDAPDSGPRTTSQETETETPTQGPPPEKPRGERG